VRLLTDSILGTPDMPVETIREFVADIGEETERLSRMTEKLMLLSRLETLPREEAEVETEPVIRRAVHMLTPLANEADVKLCCELTGELSIEGGKDDLYHIVFNLIDNAVKYNKRGGKVQILSFRHGDEVHIVVSDTGIGIPQQDIPFIYDRFYRIDKGRSRAAGGAGLGLSIVAQTACQLGGSISVESTPGEGSSFRAAFPIWKGEQL
jgi:signal transduction histidine kinase